MPLDMFGGRWFGTGPADGSSPAVAAGGLDGRCLVAPLLTSRERLLADQINVATALARANGSSLYLANPGASTDRTPIAFRHGGADPDESDLLDWALAETRRPTWCVDRGVLSARRIAKEVSRIAAANDADTVVLPGVSANDSVAGKAVERIARETACDSIVVNGRRGFDSAPSILLPIAGGPHSGVATDVAARIAADTDAWIDVLHVVDADATEQRRDEAEAYVETAARRVGRPDTTSTWVLEADDPIDAIVEQSRYHPVTVIGAPTKGRLRRFVSGSTNKSIRSQAQSVVLSARNDSGRAALATEGDGDSA